MESEGVPAKVEKPKTKQKKKLGKIAKVFKLHKEGKNVKEIAEETGLKERLIRSYIWRKQNPKKYAELLKRYFAKKQKQEKTEENKTENE